MPWALRSSATRNTIGQPDTARRCSLDQSTPCSQSQIGPDPHLRQQRTAQVEAALALSVVIRLGPAMTAVNGTLVARPARTTWHTLSR
jgi:hypothetical protein